MSGGRRQRVARPRAITRGFGPSGTSAGSAVSTTKRNSLGLTQDKLNTVLDFLDENGADHGKSKRIFTRLPLRLASVMVDLLQANGDACRIVVAARNISSGGIAVLHNAFTHAETRCRIHLPVSTGGMRELGGEVTRCQHVRGMVHELGLRFDEPVDPRMFLDGDRALSVFSIENVEPSSLRGSVLFVSPEDKAHSVMSEHLEGTHINLRRASSGADGLVTAARGVDLILCASDVGDMTCGEFAAKLMETYIGVPVVMVSGEALSETSACADVIDGVVAQPLTADSVLRAVAEFVLPGSPHGPFHLPDDSGRREAAQTFIGKVPRRVKQLRDAAQEDDLDRIVDHCHSLINDSLSAGFGLIASQAQSLQVALATTDTLGNARRPMRGLLLACARLRADDGFSDEAEAA